MKSKISKIMGIGLALVLLVSLMVFALPASADPYPPLAPAAPNTWAGFPPTPGGPPIDAWFNDPAITKVGPIAEAINGDLFAYVAGTAAAPNNPGADDIFKSTDGGRTWSASPIPFYYGGGPVVDMVCSELSEDVIYLTDGNYVYRSINGGTSFAIVAQGSLETALGTVPAGGTSITCLDVGYLAGGDAFVFIGTTTSVTTSQPSVFYFNEGAFASAWTDLNLSAFGDVLDNYTPYSIGVAPDFATSKKIYTVVSRGASLEIFGDGIAEWSINEADPRGYSAYLASGGTAGTGDEARIVIPMPAGTTLGDIESIAWSVYAVAGYPPHVDIYLDVDEDGVVDDEDVLTAEMYYNNASYLFGLVDWCNEEVIYGGWLQTFELTPADGFDAVDDTSLLWLSKFGGGPGDAPESTLAQWKAGIVGTDLGNDLPGGTVIDGTAPVLRLEIEVDNWMIESEAYVDDITINGETYSLPGETHVVSTIGIVSDWTPVAELQYNCATNFEIDHASRFAFSTAYDTNSTMFIGVAGETVGGDVYRVVDTIPPSGAIDLNVRGFTTGCLGLFDANICSLDIKAGDALIAGGFDGTTVYYSNDGGWTWAASAPVGKSPTGFDLTYVLWVGDSALAATDGADCAVSLSCGQTVGQYFNQISLIDMDIVQVLDLSHAPGYLDGSSTMYALTYDATYTSLLRWDGTYWERVFFSTTAPMNWVEVSPDFNKTGCVYLANTSFDMFRSMDAGCSWAPLVYPCTPKPTISAWIVVDEETVLASGSVATGPEMIYKTLNHGTQPWDAFPPTGAGDGIDFDLSPNIANDNSVLFGDATGQVFISANVGSTWDMVAEPGPPFFGVSANTYVIFDPSYGTGDPDPAGVNMIYAAAGNTIGRCDTTDAPWMLQDWVRIDSAGDLALADASGIAAAGDTALYVADGNAVNSNTGGVLRTLNPMAPVEPYLVEFERLTEDLTMGSALAHPQTSDDLWLTAGGNMLWALDSDNPTTIWMWDDVLATPVIQIAPAGGALLATTTTATIEWEPLDGATSYEYFIFSYCPTCPDNMVLFETDTTVLTCNVIDGLTPGTTYYWKVRVALGEPVLSKWSDLRTFDTALGSVTVLCSPICGASDIILTTNFSWDPVPGAASYEVQIATNEDFDPVIASGTPKVNAWAAAPELDYSTTYYWRVRAAKDGVVGAWSVCLFTTMAEPVEPVEPITPVDVIIEEVTPLWIWVIIGIGAALVICVVVLIVTTRRMP